MNERIRPSGVWYALGAVLLAAGVIGGFVIGGVGIFSALDRPEDFQRVEVPGDGTVTFDEPGGYVLYLEGVGAAPSGNLAVDDVALLPDRPDGRPLPLSRYDTSLTYTSNGREGKADLTFNVSETGRYRLEVDNPPPGVTTVAVGRSYASDLVVPIVLAGALGLGGLIIGGTILIVTGVRRGRAKRQRRLRAWPAQAPR